ncbi:MAG TPA: hypothetical protein VH333_05750, partial [Pseudonocardiaceae bacterium]|nr:hypothetical protein [Pseudonocardiaceae bacterium]
GADQRTVVARELLLAWPRFHPTRYAESVLRESPLLGGHVRIDDPSLIPGLVELKSLRRLDCRFHDGHGDLAFVPDLSSLHSLTVADPKVRNLSPLAGTGLKRLALASTRHDQHGIDLRYVPPEVAVIRLPLEIDLAPLRDVRTLTRLDVLRPSSGWSQLATLPVLTSLQLSNIINVTRLAELTELTDLTSLSLRDVMWTTSDLTPLAFLRAPRAIGLTNCPFLVELRELSRWADSLEQLWLRDCPDVSLDGLTGLTGLHRLDLSGSRVTDLTPISHLTELKVLRLGRSEPVPDLTPLRGLRHLNRLWCYDSGDVDLTPFAGRPGIVVYVSRRQNVSGAETLGPGSRVERH